MLKQIHCDGETYHFSDNINKIKDYYLIDAIGSIFGGFTNTFDNGNGRRITLSEDEVEVTMEANAIINGEKYNFIRTYTDIKADTESIDKLQDICKYANNIKKKITSKEDDFLLPVIAYYSNEIEFTSPTISLQNIKTVFDRDLAYESCLITFNKFNQCQQFFTIASFIAWHISNIKENTNFVNNFNKTMDYLNEEIRSIGYGSFYYDIEDNKIKIFKDNEKILLEDIENKFDQMYIMILFDIAMRTLILNGEKMNSLDDVEACITISYPFDKKTMNQLANVIKKMLKKAQIFILV